MKPAYCQYIEIIVHPKGTGKDKSYKYDLTKYFKASFSDDAAEIEKENTNLQTARKKCDEELAGTGVELNVYIANEDLLKIYYIPIFKRKQDPSASAAEDIAAGKVEVMTIAGRDNDEVLNNYDRSLGKKDLKSKENIENYNISDSRIFDPTADEPKLKFEVPKDKTVAAEYNKKYGEIKSGGFETAGVIAWRKIYYPASDNSVPDVSDFFYVTDCGQGSLVSWARNTATNARQIGIVSPWKVESERWLGTRKNTSKDKDKVVFETTNNRFIMRIKGEVGSFDGNFDWKTLALPLAGALPLLPFVFKKDPDPNPNPDPVPVPDDKGTDAYYLALNYYVLSSDYLNKYGIDAKPGELAEFDSKYEDWTKNKWVPWRGNNAIVAFYSLSPKIEICPAECDYAVHEANGVRIDFDGRWTALPVPPEYAGIRESESGEYYADDYFGRYDFVNGRYRKISKGGSDKTVAPLSGDDWLNKLESGGDKDDLSLPESTVFNSRAFKSLKPHASANLYAVYTMKLFVGYYVYDYNFSAWSQLGEGYWVNYGDPFPVINGYVLPASGKTANGISTISYYGKWIVSSSAPKSGSNVFSIDNAMILQGGSESVPAYSTNELKNQPAITAPTYVYAAYKSTEVTFIWYTYEFEEGKTDSGSWKEFYKSEGFPMKSEPFAVDANFVGKHNDVAADDPRFVLLNGKYVYSKNWLLLNDSSKAPEKILKTGDSFIENCGTAYAFDDFKNGAVMTDGSNRATYCFYAIYDPNKMYDVKFYVITGWDKEKKDFKWEEAPAPDNAVWSKILAKEDDETKPIDILLPTSVNGLSLAEGDYKGAYEFSNMWYVRKGADENRGSDDFSKGSSGIDASSLGYALNSDVAGSKPCCVNGLVGSEDDKKKLALALDKDAMETVYRLYAVYDKVYTARFHLLGTNLLPKNGEDKVDWKDTFTVPIKVGQMMSLTALESSAGVLNDILSGIIEKGKAAVESGSDNSEYAPAWDLTGGAKYEFSGYWLNTTEADNMRKPMTALIKSCFVKSTDDKSAFGSLWNLTDKDDSKHGTKKAEAFDPNKNFFCDDDNFVDFYGVYWQTKKSYVVRFYYPTGSDGSELEWKEIEPLAEWSQMVDFNQMTANIPLPDMNDLKKIKLNAVEGKEEKEKRIGDYEFSWCWLRGESNAKSWYSGYSLRESIKNSTAEVKELKTELNMNVMAVDGPEGGSLVAELNEASDIEYRLYAVYDKIFDVEFYIIGDKYDEIPSKVEWKQEPVYATKVKEGQMMTIEDLKGDNSNTVKKVFDDLRKGDDVGVVPVWGLPGGKTHVLLDVWYNPSDDDDMTNPDIVSSHCFVKDKGDDKFNQCWELLEDDANKAYETKNSSVFDPYASKPNFHVDKEDGKVKFYAVYLPASGVEYVFYVVTSFAEEQFKWAPYKFKSDNETEEQEIHTVEYNGVIADPDVEKPIEIVPSSERISGGKIPNDGVNKLVFKGWRRIDPANEFLKESSSVLECFDVNDSGSKELLDACACQRVAKSSLVEKSNMYWAKGSFESPSVSDGDVTSPFIYVAVYEYQQAFIDFKTLDPVYSPLSCKYSGNYAYGDTDKDNRLYEGQIVLSAGNGWKMDVERKRYMLNPKTKLMILKGSESYSRNLDSGRYIDIHEGEKGDKTSVFMNDGFECAVWWITNPSGYVMPVGFYTKGSGTFTMPAAPGEDPKYSSSSVNDGASSDDGNASDSLDGETKSKRRR